jgi:hypothetical protein
VTCTKLTHVGSYVYIRSSAYLLKKKMLRNEIKIYIQYNSEWLEKEIKLSEVVSDAQNPCCLILGRTRKMFNESSERSNLRRIE